MLDGMRQSVEAMLSDIPIAHDPRGDVERRNWTLINRMTIASGRTHQSFEALTAHTCTPATINDRVAVEPTVATHLRARSSQLFV